MSDEMDGKFKQIADLIGQNSNANIPDSIKGLLNMLSTNNNTKEESPSEAVTQNPESKEDSPSGAITRSPKPNEESKASNSDDAADIARKVKKAASMLNSANDPKVTLLNALKPFLNKNRQRKLQTCMKLMKIGSLTKILDDSEGRPV
jgi:hypothetical protein